jgi:hypothetical protein
MRISILYFLLIFSSNAFSQCNGSQDLCSKRYDEVAYLTTHNAFNAQSQGYTFPNQNYGLTQQLNDGVRGLMLDVYSLSGIPSVYHGISIFGNDPLSSNLFEIKDFLDANTNEIVTIIFECYVSANVIESEFDNVGLLNYLYTKPSGSEWDYLQDMINSNKRLVIFTDEDDASTGQEWYHYAWDYCVETNYTVDNINDFNNDFNRGDSINDLFIFNHFVTDPTLGIGVINTAAVVNEYAFLMPRIQQHYSEKLKFPNFVTIDFHDLGEGKTIVDSLNSSTFVGINEFEIQNIKLYPNPCNNYTMIINLDKATNYSITIYNSIGVIESTVKAEFQAELQLNLSKLSSGFYLVQINDNSGQTSIQRLIVN